MATNSSPATTLSLSLARSKPTSPSSTTSLSFSSSLSLSSNRAGLKLVTRPRSAPTKRFSCNCMFGLGVPELAVIAGVATLVFGPKQLPEVGRTIGKTFKSFQQAAKEFELEMKKDPGALAEPALEEVKAVSQEENQHATVSSTREAS
nr:sec-independent protein translocase protein TATA, chloroplastic [Ipomoea batatas]GMD77866.1 sec-independent protein translocase protein TATA, chloroplastic [Ipomoea batatas]